MHSIISTALLALNLGPMAPDAPAREPQLAANGSTVALTFGAGSAIYFAVSHDSGRTFSALHEVKGKARQEEIARMLGGNSESALKHAASLLSHFC